VHEQQMMPFHLSIIALYWLIRNFREQEQRGTAILPTIVVMVPGRMKSYAGPWCPCASPPDKLGRKRDGGHRDTHHSDGCRCDSFGLLP
jgi:hypothetical protein